MTPFLKVDAPAGAVIGIQTDHYDDGAGLVGIEPGTQYNMRATYVCAGGVQEFEPLAWMSGTAVRYTIPAGVTILELKYRESGYDTDFAGSFSSSDPLGGPSTPSAPARMPSARRPSRSWRPGRRTAGRCTRRSQRRSGPPNFP
ncbi:hypothetical protein ABZZ80_26630, partial [Streptomyces sp. NPDC006356]